MRWEFVRAGYVDENAPSSTAYDGAYALMCHSDTYRQVARLFFDFDQLQEYGVELTAQIEHRNRHVVKRPDAAATGHPLSRYRQQQ